MVAKASNRVRALREARGLSQLALAERARLTRQSVGAIEAGRSVPAVDVALRIARALGCTIEELFADGAEPAELDVELGGEALTPRVALSFVHDRWLGLPLGPGAERVAADGLVTRLRGARASVAPLRPLAELRDTLLLTGCATGLGLLADRLRLRRGAGGYHWSACSSAAALRALSEHRAHVAGVHSAGDDGRANVEAARRAGVGQPLVLITLARWQAGWLTRPADTRVRTSADLGARGLRLVAREKGAGARLLLERQLRAAGLPLELVRSAALVASGHLEVARAVALGAADVGLATRDAALASGLRFVPITEERYDLVIPASLLADARVERLLDTLVSAVGRRELAALGYDVSCAGTRVAEVSA